MNCPVAFWIAVSDRNELPEWARTVALVSSNIYVPAAIAGDELGVTALAALDGVPTLQHLGHAFVPLRWMAAEFPRTTELLGLVERRISEAVAEVQDAALQSSPECKHVVTHG